MVLPKLQARPSPFGQSGPNGSAADWYSFDHRHGLRSTRDFAGQSLASHGSGGRLSCAYIHLNGSGHLYLGEYRSSLGGPFPSGCGVLRLGRKRRERTSPFWSIQQSDFSEPPRESTRESVTAGQPVTLQGSI